ncbi:hypothetical protein METBIDRAFT_102286 [Metschnikowia bicuspidata var. bicuspidata NRRL YB-4993]|uniref:Uncharacterized protein n=1 Tax=Metschnikowia bicuspidata var. bicuspidata NRRL YB-4993 TaxID=869754 RepID=A0A1A0HGE1_9ASCO|nr:hypothetical protein METBIDRAFT_102286 [Metschnikowia bicuspidata var. bicuspidata NRRL YB-4993]OBA23234.1 hypothetical protein METBIDRAFT_102286 [Metschnikowia bicuspidata var. bicuspidata NRRL YB-4993]
MELSWRQVRTKPAFFQRQQKETRAYRAARKRRLREMDPSARSHGHLYAFLTGRRNYHLRGHCRKECPAPPRPCVRRAALSHGNQTVRHSHRVSPAPESPIRLWTKTSASPPCPNTGKTASSICGCLLCGQGPALLAPVCLDITRQFARLGQRMQGAALCARRLRLSRQPVPHIPRWALGSTLQRQFEIAGAAWRQARGWPETTDMGAARLHKRAHGFFGHTACALPCVLFGPIYIYMCFIFIFFWI